MDYDGLNRLTWTDAPGLLTTALYAYDALDNLRWVNYSGYGREPQQHRYDVDAKNRHWRYFITNGTASITRTYTHDARGNRLGSTTPGPAFGTRNYTYDRTNRMTSSNDGATWEYYWYDGHGRRTVINRPGGNTVQIYSRDGRLVYERAPGGSTTKHIYLAGRLVGSMTGSTTTYLHTDTLGTVVRRTNAAGQELGPRQTWEPYGSLSNGQYLQAPGFTSHVSDVHSGLIYMQQRHYDPVAMRFMSVDPVHVDTRSGGNFNRYWYANNNPYRYVDPDGEHPVVVACAANAGACGGAIASAAGAIWYGAKAAVNSLTGNSAYNEAVADSASPAEGTSGEAADKISEGARPAVGGAGARGELERDGGEEGAHEVYDSAPGTNDRTYPNGTRVKDTADGGVVELHNSSGRGGDYPRGTPTIKVQDANKAPIRVVRFPRD